jgi:hypothetical protein
VEGKATYVDFTVVQALPPNIAVASATASSSRSAVELAEQNKRTKYAALFDRHPTLHFLPVGFDTFGQLGPSAKIFFRLLDQLTTKATLNDNEDHQGDTPDSIADDTDAIPFWHRLSVALMRSLGSQLCGILPLCRLQDFSLPHIVTSPWQPDETARMMQH